MTPPPDSFQADAVAAVVGGPGNLVVVGEPGAGKTSVVIAAAAAAVHGGLNPAGLMVLAPTRAAAARLRDKVALAIDRPAGAPVVRTAASLAHAILRSVAEAEGRPAPVLVTGAEQDVMLREILEGHLNGRVDPLDWAGALPAHATALPGLRAELRDLLMRASEAGLVPEDLEDLAVRVGRPEWRAAATVMREYLGITTLRSTPADQGARYDPASVVAEAAHALRTWQGGGRPHWDLVIVDDAQDATAAVHDLLKTLAEAGSRVVLVGNADQAVQGYRGAVPAALAGATGDKGPYALDAQLIALGPGHRQPPPLAAVSAAFAQRIGTLGVGSPRSAPAGVGPEGDGASEPGRVNVLTAPHRYGQSRAIAAHLRRARHGLDGEPVPWGRMCVIARSAAQLRELRSDLAAADIPCVALGESVALHAEPAVEPLLRILRAAAGEVWTEPDALAVLGSRLVGLDPVALRRLRRELVREDRAGGGTASSGELLVDAMQSSARWASIRGPEARAAAAASRAVEAATARMGEPGATPGAVLWAAWAALGVAEVWRAGALAGSARDDADLDAVIALLRAAQTYSERLPQARVIEFVAYLEAQDFAADSLGARAATGDVVEFCTAASAAGREWDVVAIAGLEEGVWPNLRLRDSVLGAQHLADIVAGRAPAVALDAAGRVAHAASSRRQVLDDETRSALVAVSRARVALIATAVVGDESRPSRFLSLIADAAGVEIADSAAPRDPMERISDLRSAVSALRSRAVAVPDPESSDLSATLAWLASQGIAGADPEDWHGVPETSTDVPLWRDDERVRVSPSKVEWIEKCALRWALESTGGTQDATEAQQVGTLIHLLAEKHPAGGVDQILRDFDAMWSEQFELDTWPQRAAFQQAREVAHKLALYLGKRAGRTVLTEQRFAVEIGRADLVGSADRVEIVDGSAYVVDIKTGRSAPPQSEAETNAQLEMYQLAVTEGALEQTRTSLGAELAYVAVNKEGASRTQLPIDPVHARERLDAVVDTMAASSFIAVVNDKCDSCPVRRACPVQVQGLQVSDA
jgi:superfamily I DNA/RNA helicase/CRISPR/Cas system-associated exonuclease Cas4 (RecB family)